MAQAGDCYDEGNALRSTTSPMEALLKLCKQLENMPRHRIKDSQTHFYLDYDNVDALIEQARKSIGEPHVFAKDYSNKVVHS